MLYSLERAGLQMKFITSFKADQNGLISERCLSGLSTHWLPSLCPCSLPSPLSALFPHDYHAMFLDTPPSPLSLIIFSLYFIYELLLPGDNRYWNLGIHFSSREFRLICHFPNKLLNCLFTLILYVNILYAIHYLLAALRLFPETGSF